MDESARVRTLAEVEAATAMRPHPQCTLPTSAMLALSEATMLACGHLDGFLPTGHAVDPEACIAARQARVDALFARLRAAGANPHG